MSKITTMSKYMPYPDYKYSGIEWLGQVPEHWLLSPIKLISDITLGKMLTPNDKGGMFKKPYLRAKNLQWQSVDVSDVKEMWFDENELKSLALKDKDLLVSEGGEVGRTSIWKSELEECYIQNSVNRVRLKHGLPTFYLYQFIACGKYGYFDSIVNRISIAHLTKEKLGSVVMASPPIEEQTQIANFLDRETRKIDTLIEKQQQLIKLLKEKRQAVISHAVTKGLNPDAPMKDSGVEWLGEVPEHWSSATPIKYLSSLKGRLGWQGLKADEYKDDGPHVVSSAHFNNHEISWDMCPRVSEERYELDSNIQLESGDILLMKDGAAMGKLAYVDDLPGKACLNSHLLLFRPLQRDGVKTFHTKFMFYLMQTEHFQGFIRNNGTGATFLGISQQAIGNHRLILPDYEEQLSIAKFLDEQVSKLSALESKKNQMMALLYERRAALISAAVTGKIDVRNWQPTDNKSTEEIEVTA